MDKQIITTINGIEIVAVTDEKRIVFVPVKPICQALGIDHPAQVQRIKRHHILSSVVVTVTTTGADGKCYDMLSLPLEFIYGWLFTIDTALVAEERRPNIEAYQRECYEALYRHFAGSLRRRLEENETEIAALQAVNDAIKQEKEAKAERRCAEERLAAIRRARLEQCPRLDLWAISYFIYGFNIFSYGPGAVREDGPGRFFVRVSLICRIFAEGKLNYQPNQSNQMKYIFRLIAVVATVILCSGGASAKDKAPGRPLVCDTVLQAPGLTADQIYSKVKVWFANSMRSSQNVIQLDDTENKHIIGKANFKFDVNHFQWQYLSGIIRFTIDVAARDGRFRLKVYDFYHEAFRDGWTEGPVYVGGPNPEIKGLRKKQNSEMQKRASELCLDQLAMMIVTLEEAMRGTTSITDDDNW